jgi:ketosteroid isomerase-like protein
MSDDGLTMVQTFLERALAGRIDDAVRFLEPDVEYQVPGRDAPADTFVGSEAVKKHLEKFHELTVTPIDVLQWDDWLVGGTDVAGIARVQLQRPGHRQKFRVIFLVEVSQGNKISRVEAYSSDPDAYKRFFT